MNLKNKFTFSLSLALLAAAGLQPKPGPDPAYSGRAGSGAAREARQAAH